LPPNRHIARFHQGDRPFPAVAIAQAPGEDRVAVAAGLEVSRLDPPPGPPPVSFSSPVPDQPEDAAVHNSGSMTAGEMIWRLNQ
jgi:hypothetical protein